MSMTIGELIHSLEEAQAAMRDGAVTPVMVLDVAAASLLDIDRVVLDNETVLLFAQDPT